MALPPETSEYIQATRFHSRLVIGGIAFLPFIWKGRKQQNNLKNPDNPVKKQMGQISISPDRKGDLKSHGM
jgi:hypothetical protein